MAADSTAQPSAPAADPADTLHLARWTVTSGSNVNSRGAVVIAAGDHQWEASAEGNGAIDAVHAVYRDSAGDEIVIQIAAYASEKRCASELERLRDAVVGLGYVQVEESVVTDPDGNEVGTRYRLSAGDEIIVWSSGTALAGIEARDFDRAMRFADDFLTASP